MNSMDEWFMAQVNRAYLSTNALLRELHELIIIEEVPASSLVEADAEREISFPPHSIDWTEALRALVLAEEHLRPISHYDGEGTANEMVKSFDVLRRLRNSFVHGGVRSEDLQTTPLIEATTSVLHILERLRRPVPSASPSWSKPRPESVVRLAKRLVACSMLALPREHRRRYAEELHGELHDLAQARATSSMQVYYALRQFTRIWQLRRALESPHKRRFEALYHSTCWVLSSEIRTWLAIGFVTLAALIDVVVEQGWGSAVLAAPTAWAFYHGACWLRKRLDIAVIGKRESDGPPPSD